jgi:hypothetical protein
MRLLLAAVLLALASDPATARDDGRYANSPLKPWFDSLRSGRGPCCSDADGSAVSDVDWEAADGHYRVRLEGVWIDVPDDAVIAEPNRAGRAMVWPMWLEGVTQEALLAIVMDRLQSFQRGPFACRENALALTKIEEAQHWLFSRTLARMQRGVEGKTLA